VDLELTMARKRKQQAAPTTLSPKPGLGMGFATNLDASTLPLPEHPLKGFKFERDSVQPRKR